MANIWLTARNMVKTFGGNRVLDDVSIDVGRGDIHGLIGPNGSGKTTLLNVLSGVLRADAGRLQISGRDVVKSSSRSRARLGLARTFQHEMSFGRLTVFDNVRIAREVALGNAADSADIVRLLDLVGLPERVRRDAASTLSWGQGRMLGMAIALATDPVVILLDEPFAGLQRMAGEAMAARLKEIASSGIGMVVVEHEMSLLLPICHRVTALAAGSVISVGSPEEILSDRAVVESYFGATL